MTSRVLSKFEIKPQFQEFVIRVGGHEQLISNSVWIKPAFAERDEKQAMIDPRNLYKLA